MSERPLTRNQTLVLDTLTRAEAPLSAYTILDQLRGDGLRAPLQVYRALERLIGEGLVHRLESINAFVACAHSSAHSDGHAHEAIAFAICDECGQVSEFSDAEIEAKLDAWASKAKFVARKTAIELRGRCSACAK